MAERKPVEQWKAEKQTPAWLFAAAKMLHRWVVGEELTEAEYEQAISETASQRLG